MGLCLHKASVSQVIHAGGLQNTCLCKHVFGVGKVGAESFRVEVNG